MSAKSEMTMAMKLEKLDVLVAWFDSDEFALEAALAKFSEAEKLAKEIEAELESFKNEIQMVRARFEAS